MTKKTKHEFAQNPTLTCPRGKATEQIDAQIGKGQALESKAITSEKDLELANNEYDRWNDFNSELLGRIFSTSKIRDEYNDVVGGVFSMNPSFGKRIGYFMDKVQGKVNLLMSVKERLSLIPDQTALSQPSPNGNLTRNVFIIHGRDEGMRESVARFVEKLKLNPIILNEQASRGSTLMEKFEDQSDVSFAIACLSPDDIGYLKSEPNNEEHRARQNVVLELGFFLGKLTRRQVCAIIKDDVTRPSDFDGVVYINYDNSGGWKALLARELKAAGLEVDMNQAL